jgi:hypothetical protein
MTLFAGTRLGPYEVLSPLGAGGIGEVPGNVMLTKTGVLDQDDPPPLLIVRDWTALLDPGER